MFRPQLSPCALLFASVYRILNFLTAKKHVICFCRLLCQVRSWYNFRLVLLHNDRDHVSYATNDPLTTLTGRRRKIRCIFPEGAESCKDCQDRGTTCTAQGVSLDETIDTEDKTQGLQKRVTELEARVEQLLDAKRSDPDARTTATVPTAYPITALNRLQDRIANGVPDESTSPDAGFIARQSRVVAENVETGPTPIMGLFKSVMVCSNPQSKQDHQPLTILGIV